jgi:hypothetical protein
LFLLKENDFYISLFISILTGRHRESDKHIGQDELLDESINNIYEPSTVNILKSVNIALSANATLGISRQTSILSTSINQGTIAESGKTKRVAFFDSVGHISRAQGVLN